jgi:hypothetical protein
MIYYFLYLDEFVFYYLKLVKTIFKEIQELRIVIMMLLNILIDYQYKLACKIKLCPLCYSTKK